MDYRENYEIEVWWDENDFFANDTGWKLLCNGHFFEGPSRIDLLLKALDL